jgi:hypothetical protein
MSEQEALYRRIYAYYAALWLKNIETARISFEGSLYSSVPPEVGVALASACFPANIDLFESTEPFSTLTDQASISLYGRFFVNYLSGLSGHALHLAKNNFAWILQPDEDVEYHPTFYFKNSQEQYFIFSHGYIYSVKSPLVAPYQLQYTKFAQSFLDTEEVNTKLKPTSLADFTVYWFLGMRAPLESSGADLLTHRDPLWKPLLNTGIGLQRMVGIPVEHILQASRTPVRKGGKVSSLPDSVLDYYLKEPVIAPRLKDTPLSPVQIKGIQQVFASRIEAAYTGDKPRSRSSSRTSSSASRSESQPPSAKESSYVTKSTSLQNVSGTSAYLNSITGKKLTPPKISYIESMTHRKLSEETSFLESIGVKPTTTHKSYLGSLGQFKSVHPHISYVESLYSKRPQLPRHKDEVQVKNKRRRKVIASKKRPLKKQKK